MEAIFPVSALQKRASEVKRAAGKDLVRITENGVGAYVFCSEAVFENRLQEACRRAAYEARVAAVMERGRADVRAGRVYRGSDAAWGEIENRAANRG